MTDAPTHPPRPDAARAVDRRQVLIAAGIILALGLVVYAFSFGGEFFFDDHKNILENPRSERPWALDRMYRSDSRPVGVFTLWLNYQIGRDDPWGYHAVNLAIHLTAALLLFGIVRRTLLAPRLRRHVEGWATPLAGLIAAAWMAHPLQTQAVTYIVQRYESLMGMFYLLTLYCAIRAFAPGPLRPAWMVGAVVAAVLGMGSKQVMVTAPLMVVIYDAIFAPGGFRRRLRGRWPLYAGLGATWVVLAVLVYFGPRSRSAGFTYEGASPADYAVTQFHVIFHYLRLALWPSGLCLDYGWPIAEGRGEILGWGIGIALLLALTVWALIHYRPWGFLGVWFFVVLAPSSSVMPIADAAVEHRMYLPLAAVVAGVVPGLFLAGRALLRRLEPEAARRERIGLFAGGAAAAGGLIALSLATVFRNLDYHSEVGMWTDVTRKAPGNYRGWDSLGVALNRAGRTTEAVRAHQRAIELNPHHADSHYNLAVALGNAGDPKRAAEACRRALRLNRRHKKAWTNLAQALKKMRRLEQAEQAHRRALAIDPRYLNAHGGLAALLEETDRLEGAERHYRAVLEVDRWHPDGNRGLVRVLRRQGKDREAFEHAQAWARARPKSPEAHMALAEVLKDRGDVRGAIKRYRAVLRLDRDHVHALNNIAWQLATHWDDEVRDGAEAVTLSERACELTGSKDPTCVDTLAAAYAEAGRFEDAVKTQRRAVELIQRAEPRRLPDTTREEAVRDYRGRLEQYQAGRSHRQGPS